MTTHLPAKTDPKPDVNDIKLDVNETKPIINGTQPNISEIKPVIKWCQERKHIVVLFVVVPIILGIGVGLGSLACGCTNTGEYVPVPSATTVHLGNTTTGESVPVPIPVPTPTTVRLGNTTTGKPVPIPTPALTPTTAAVDNTPSTVPPPLTLEEQHELQEQEVVKLQGCHLVNTSLKVMDVLYKNPEDSLLDEYILTRYISVPRCQGFCGRGDCQALDMEEEDFLVQYIDENDTFHYVKRKVMHHKLCQCEGK